jgi:hypothetical protein
MPHIPTAYPAWTLRAWPPLLWQVSREIRLQLHHVGTQVHEAGHGPFGSAGQTVWAGQCDEGDAGMAWDWIALGQGVVAMADPLAVVTNLCLVGEQGQALTRYETARHIHQIVYQLPWQIEVARVLGELASRPVEPARGQPRPAPWPRLGEDTTH